MQSLPKTDPETNKKKMIEVPFLDKNDVSKYLAFLYLLTYSFLLLILVEHS